jgi:hypothetical protein
LLKAAVQPSSSFWIEAVVCASAGVARIIGTITVKMARNFVRGMSFSPFKSRDIHALSHKGQFPI